MLSRTVRQTQRGAGGFYEHHRVCRSAAPAERIEAGASLITCVCVCRPLLTDAHYSPMVLLCSPGFVVHVEHDLLFGRHVIHFAAIFSDEVQIERPKASWRSSERGGAMRVRDDERAFSGCTSKHTGVSGHLVATHERGTLPSYALRTPRPQKTPRAK